MMIFGYFIKTLFMAFMIYPRHYKCLWKRKIVFNDVFGLIEHIEHVRNPQKNPLYHDVNQTQNDDILRFS